MNGPWSWHSGLRPTRRSAISGLLAIFGIALVAPGLWIPAKALLAQRFAALHIGMAATLRYSVWQ